MLTLYSNCLLGKYVQVYAAHLRGKELERAEIFYNDTLPCFEYMPYEQKKNLELLAVGCGEHDISFDGQPIKVTVEIVGGDNIVHDAHSLDLLRKITITARDVEVASSFVKKAKEHVEDIIDMNKKLKSRVRKFVYSIKRGEWETLNVSNKRTTDSIFLAGNKKQDLLQTVRDFASNETKEVYAKYNIPYKLNIMLHGAPGTGKTSTAHAIASELESDIAIMQFTRHIDDLTLSQALNSIVQLDKCRVLIMEDIDSLFIDRKEGDTDRNNVTLSGLLNALDGVARVEGLIVVLTTNRLGALDDAILRTGRMDMLIEYEDHVTKDQLTEMFNYYFPSHPAAADIVSRIVEKTSSRPITIAMMQQYFFKNRKCPELLGDKVNELIDMAKLRNNKDGQAPMLYT